MATSARLPVGILWRLPATLAAIAPPLAAALGALTLIRALHALSLAGIGTGGMGLVLDGLRRGHLPVLVALDIAAVLGLAALAAVVAGSRHAGERRLAMAPAWYYPLATTLGLLPPTLLAIAQSLIVGALGAGSGDVEATSSRIAAVVLATIGSGLAAPPLLLAAAVLPLRTSQPAGGLAIGASAGCAAALLAAAVAFHLRLSWLEHLAAANPWPPGN